MDCVYIHSKLTKLNNPTPHEEAPTHVQEDEYMIVATGSVLLVPLATFPGQIEWRPWYLWSL